MGKRFGVGRGIPDGDGIDTSEPDVDIEDTRERGRLGEDCSSEEIMCSWRIDS